MDKKLTLKLTEFENDILEVVDGQKDYTRSDLQGRVWAIVVSIYRAGKADNGELQAILDCENCKISLCNHHEV